MKNNVILNLKIELSRNIEELPFPSRLSDSSQALLVSKAIQNVFDDEFEYRTLKNLSQIEALKLLESQIITKNELDNKDISSYAILRKKNLRILMNGEDHIKLVISSCEKLEELFQIINEYDERILNTINIAFSEDLGFLTTMPNLVGTAMKVKCTLFVPALKLNGVLEEYILKASHYDLEVLKLTPEDKENKCYFIEVENKYCLGQSEEEIITNIKNYIELLKEKELENRQRLKQVNKIKIYDDALRAYGVLTNTYIISGNESIKLISDLMLAQELDLLSFKQANLLNELLIKHQSAHIMDYYSLDMSPIEREKFRAKYLRDNLANKIIKSEVVT